MFTFKKSERITSLKEIDSLFERGKSSSVVVFPIRAVYQTYLMPQDKPAPAVKVLVSVAKKRLHHAVDRNRAKRQVREAYRLLHLPLTEAVKRLNPPTGLRVAFIWLSDTPQPTSKVFASTDKIMSLMEKKLTSAKQ